MDNFAELPDFVTLYTKDAINATPTNLEFKWNLPDSYYSPDRASTAYVTLVGVMGDFVGVGAGSIAVVMKDGGSNYASTDNRGIVLGGLYDNDATNQKPISQGAIQPLIKSKPQTIEIHFTDLDGSALTRPAGFSSIVTLRFDYIKPKEQIAGLESTFQPNLL
tara:strand:- start:810 stop:1298 length:489 start_codon:yes stop_codon:yes gene_type:complete